MRTISEDRLRELAQGYETWSKTASSRPQIDIDTADALRELLSLRAPPSGEAGEVVYEFTPEQLAELYGDEISERYRLTDRRDTIRLIVQQCVEHDRRHSALPTIKEPSDGK